MAIVEKTGLMGLMTNVAETQAPPGTLIEAENVVIRRPGCIEPRDGLQLAGTLSSGFAAYGFSWRSKDFILRNDGSNTFDWRDTAGGTYRFAELATNTTIDPQPMRRDVFSRVEARASLYVPCTVGTVKMESDAGPWKMAGVPHTVSIQDVALPSTAYGSWIAPNQQVGYRAVLLNKDANRMETRSKPTGVVVKQNTTASACGFLIRIWVVGSSGLANIDWTSIELYRTRNFNVTDTVDDEMQLVSVIPKENTTYLTGAWYIDFIDGVAESARGTTLYTSPSRGGIDEQNERPPAAAVTALFKGSVFFGNIRSQRRIVISATFRGSITTATGIGTRAYTANMTAGSNQLTSLSSTVGLEKGMYVNGTVVTFITAISGTTVTLNDVMTATVVGATYTFTDAIKVAGQWVPIGNQTGFSPAPLLSLFRIGSILFQSLYPPEGGNSATFAIESLSRDTTAQTIQATHGSEYTPPLPNYDGTPLSLDQDVWPGSIAWSKTDEPEHVRPIDYTPVGDVAKAVLALVPTRDALFIVKEDGIFRLSGANGVWRVDPFDPTARCMLPSSARALRGRGIFLGDRGVALFSDDNGIELASYPVNDLVKPLIDQIQANWLSTGFYELPGMAGGNAACVFERETEYTLARGSSTAPFVYNDVTGAWTTLAYYGHANESLSYRALFNFARAGNCVLSLGVAYYKTILSTDAGASYLRYDRATAVTVSSYSAPNATLSAAMNALEDDVIKDSAGRYWRVTADVNNSATVPVELPGGTATMATGASTLYRSLRCSVVATGFTQPISAQKRWSQFLTAWTTFVGPVRLRYAYQSSESPAWVEENARTSLVAPVPDPNGNGYASYALGLAAPAYVPNASARAWLLRTRVRWAQVFGDAQLEAISAEVSPQPSSSPQQVSA